MGLKHVEWKELLFKNILVSIIWGVYILRGGLLFLPTLMHYAWIPCLRAKNIDLTHQGQFLMPDSQIWTSCSLAHDKNSMKFPPCQKGALCWLCVLTLSQHTKIIFHVSVCIWIWGTGNHFVGKSLDIFGKRSDIFGKSSEIFGSGCYVFGNPRKSWQVYTVTSLRSEI